LARFGRYHRCTLSREAPVYPGTLLPIRLDPAKPTRVETDTDALRSDRAAHPHAPRSSSYLVCEAVDAAACHWPGRCSQLRPSPRMRNPARRGQAWRARRRPAVNRHRRRRGLRRDHREHGDGARPGRGRAPAAS